MIPLCTTAISPLGSVWGWALWSLGAPWVAQRVWPMPVDPATGSASSISARRESLPSALRTTRVRPSQTATPAES